MPSDDSPYATPAISVGLPFTGGKLEGRPSLSEEEEARAYSDRCGICQWTLSFKKQYPTKRCSACRNIFHPRCLSEWYRGSNVRTCPLCNYDESEGRNARGKYMSAEETMAQKDAQRATASAPSFFPNAGYEEPPRRERRRTGLRRDGTEQDMKIRAHVNWGDVETESRSDDADMTREEYEHPSLYDRDYFLRTTSETRRTAGRQRIDIASPETTERAFPRGFNVESQPPQARRSNVLGTLRAASPPRRRYRGQVNRERPTNEFRRAKSREFPIIPGEAHRNEKLEHINREYSASNGSDPFARWYSHNSSAGPLSSEASQSSGGPSKRERGRRRVLHDEVDPSSERGEMYAGGNSRDKRLAEDRSVQSRLSEWQAAMPVIPSTISRDNTANAESQQRALLMRVLR